MAIKGDGSLLTIALRDNYAKAAWANRSADVRLRVFLAEARLLRGSFPLTLKKSVVEVKPMQEPEDDWSDTINFTATCEDVSEESVLRE